MEKYFEITYWGVRVSLEIHQISMKKYTYSRSLVYKMRRNLLANLKIITIFRKTGSAFSVDEWMAWWTRSLSKPSIRTCSYYQPWSLIVVSKIIALDKASLETRDIKPKNKANNHMDFLIESWGRLDLYLWPNNQLSEKITQMYFRNVHFEDVRPKVHYSLGWRGVSAVSLKSQRVDIKGFLHTCRVLFEGC